MIYCHQCGTQLQDTLKFCTSCGARQSAPEESAAAQLGTGSLASSAPVGAPDLAPPVWFTPESVESSAPAAPPPVVSPMIPDVPGYAAPAAPHAPPATEGPSVPAAQAPAFGAPSVAPVGPAFQSPPPIQQGYPPVGSAPVPQWAPGAPGNAWQAPPAAPAGAGLGDLRTIWTKFGPDASRAVVSVFLLLMSLGLGWNSRGSAADTVLALLAILIALPVGIIDLILRPNVVGRTFTSAQRQLFRLALITPLVLFSLWAVVDHTLNAAGFGPAIGAALAGAAVGVTGAQSQADTNVGRLWGSAAALAFVGAMVWELVVIIQTIKSASEIGGFLGNNPWLLVGVAVLGSLWLIVLSGQMAVGALGGRPETAALGWWLAAVLGAWFLCLRLFTDVFDGGLRSSPVLGSDTFFAVGAALMTAVAIRWRSPQPAGHLWMSAAHAGLLTIFTAALVQAGQIVLALSSAREKGVLVWLLVLMAAGAAAAALTRAQLRRNPSAARVPVLAFCAIFSIALWLTYLVAKDIAVYGFRVFEAVLLLGPLAVIMCLTVPASVRRMLGPIGVPAALKGAPVPPSGGAPGPFGQPGPYGQG